MHNKWAVTKLIQIKSFLWHKKVFKITANNNLFHELIISYGATGISIAQKKTDLIIQAN